MVGPSSAHEEEQARLAGARREFVSSLPRRLEVLRGALSALSDSPTEGKRQHDMLRRIHALGSAARVLGFATVAEVLAEAERAVHRASRPGNQALALQDVSRALDLLPSLVLGGPAAPLSVGTDLESRAGELAYPISVLLFGAQTLADALSSDERARVELERTEDPKRAREIASSIAPDVGVIDADRPFARDLVETLVSDPELEKMPLLVIGSFVSPEAATAYVTLGAQRVLPKPVSPETLRRTLFELHELGARPRSAREPIGEVTVDALVDRITQEFRRGLVESIEAGGQSTAVNFGEGADVLAATWGAVARVRELVTVRSQGTVRFQPFGPEGAIPLAAWVSDERRAGDRTGRHGRGAEDVVLGGRRILVADDDPAVVWFMTGLFKAVGAEVIEAHDGLRALERVFEAAPDLVVSDVLMPGRDGFALCHEIKRDVVARDIPVILLSWKEDLLQRVRELGADADGYLRKEAAASIVVERVREVLRPRARIEQRLLAGGESRGRLDGITPRFVLERVCHTIPDAAFTIRDAVYLYEIQVRDGLVRTATRTAADGSFERGERVLAGLLGVSAGRFAVQPDQSPCRSQFQEPLETLLGRHIERARRALYAIAAERLSRVTRVHLDRESVGGYLQCTPQSARQLIEHLASGASPRSMLLSGEASPRLLESVLSDLARRGAVLSVERDDADTVVLQPFESRSRSSAPAAAPVPAPAPREAGEPPATVATLDSSWSSAAPVAMETRTGSPAVSDASVGETAVIAALSPLPPSATESQVLDPGTPPTVADPDAEQGWFRTQSDASAPVGLPPVAAIRSPAPSPSHREESVPDVVPASEEIEFAQIAQTLGGLGPTPEPLVQNPLSGRRPALRLPEQDTPSPGMAEIIAAAAAEEHSGTTDSGDEAPAPGSPATTSLGPKAEAPLDATLVSEGAPSPEKPGPSARNTPVNREEAAPDPSSTSKSGTEPQAEPARSSGGLFRTAGLALLAFIAAFGLVRYAIVPMLKPKDVAPVEAPSPDSNPASAPAAAP